MDRSIVDDMEIRLHLEGPARRLGARQVLEAASNMLVLLDEAAKHDQATIDWAIVDTSHHSFALVFAPVSDDARIEDLARGVVRNLTNGLTALRETAAIPRGWNHRMVRAAQGAAVSGGGVTGVSIRIDEETHPLDVVVSSNAKAALSGTQTSIGSVIGQLETITVHEKNQASVWLDVDGRRVIVDFADDQREEVRVALGERVEIMGRLIRDSAGNPVRVQARRIERLPSFDESPPLAELIGLDPDFTGDMSASDYVRKIRGEAV